MYSLIVGDVFEIDLDVGVRWPRGRNPPSTLLWNGSHKNALAANCNEYAAANWSWRWRVLVRTPGLKSSFNAFISFVYMLDLITGIWSKQCSCLGALRMTSALITVRLKASWHWAGGAATVITARLRSDEMSPFDTCNPLCVFCRQTRNVALCLLVFSSDMCAVSASL